MTVSPLPAARRSAPVALPRLGSFGLGVLLACGLAACNNSPTPRLSGDVGAAGTNGATATGAGNTGTGAGNTGTGNTGAGNTGTGSTDASSTGTGGTAAGTGSTGTGTTGATPVTTGGRNFLIQPGPNATDDMVNAMIQAAPGDVIEFGCGFFDLTSTFQLTDTEDVLVKGCGRDKTVLSFKNNNAPEGVLAVNVQGVTYQDFTVADTGGNGFELRGVDHGTLRNVRAIWSSGGGRYSATPITADNYTAPQTLHVNCTDPPTQDPTAPENTGGDTTSPDYTPSPKSGRYGVYPVSSSNILVDNAESVGASDAGIYVGQTSTAIIQNSRSAYNVFGFEIENVRGGEYNSNVAECNTGGFLIYDLDSLRQYGDKSVMHGNISRYNNTYNFTAGGIVGSVPPGSGMITLAYDRIAVYDNQFIGNNTAGIIHTSYEIFPEGAGRPGEKRIDWYTEGLDIYNNTFENNGNNLPIATSNAIQKGDVAKVLPAIVGAKNQAACANPANAAACAAATNAGTPAKAATGFRGADIVWDGLMDTYDPTCPYPKDASGNPVPADERGKPLLTNDVPNPSCHYNAYKFDTAKDKTSAAPRVKPDWWFSCIASSNVFKPDSLPFANFNGTKGANAAIKIALMQTPSATDLTELQQFPASFDMTAQNCPKAYGRPLAALPEIVIPPFVRSGKYDPAPAQALVDKLCGTVPATGQVNFDAAGVNCPYLSDYNLFADPSNPTSKPNSAGIPYSLNSKLFSDNAVKYRVLYMPPGTKAVYQDSAGTNPDPTIIFPVGTIVAKTFTFADEDKGTETPAETRVLIRRNSLNGVAHWQGMSYLWVTENGKRVAKLKMGGATLTESWVHTDVDSGIKHTGSTTSYLVPNANQCLTCHSRSESDPGSAPIGTKVRFMNKVYKPESRAVTGQSQHPISGQNQIAYLCAQGLMMGCPADLAKVEKSPVFNVPGSSGFAADSDADIEARARAWLEVNCQHCHNSQGYSKNTGLYLDSINKLDANFGGICKRPTATGEEGSGKRVYDIHPANSADSIIAYRIGAAATTPAARMPPVARSVVDEEGSALVTRWIDNVIKNDTGKYANSDKCNS